MHHPHLPHLPYLPHHPLTPLDTHASVVLVHHAPVSNVLEDPRLGCVVWVAIHNSGVIDRNGVPSRSPRPAPATHAVIGTASGTKRCVVGVYCGLSALLSLSSVASANASALWCAVSS